MRRALRAGLGGGLAVGVTSGLFAQWFSEENCRSTAGDQYPCLGEAVVGAVVGTVLVVLVVLWSLRGRGAVHAVGGAAACLVGGYVVTDRVDTLWALDGVSGPIVFGLVTGVFLALWARFLPALRLSKNPRSTNGRRTDR